MGSGGLKASPFVLEETELSIKLPKCMNIVIIHYLNSTCKPQYYADLRQRVWELRSTKGLCTSHRE